MKRCAAAKFAAIKNGPPTKISAEHSSAACEDDRVESSIAIELGRVEIRLLMEGRPAEIHIFRKDGRSEIRNSAENVFAKIRPRENEPLEVQIDRLW